MRTEVLPDRGVKGAVRLYAVIVRPILGRWLLAGRCERRYFFPVLHILDDEPVRGLRECDHVVALPEQMQPVAVENLEEFVIGRQIVRLQKGLACDRH